MREFILGTMGIVCLLGAVGKGLDAWESHQYAQRERRDAAENEVARKSFGYNAEKFEKERNSNCWWAGGLGVTGLVLLGVAKEKETLIVRRPDACPRCGGEGRINQGEAGPVDNCYQWDTCPDCRGSGIKPDEARDSYL